MELLIATGIGVLTAAGVYLLLRERTFPVLLGLTLLSYAVNLFVFASGGLTVGAAPRIRPGVEHYADPLAQALVLTAIVISFAMTAFVVVLAIVAHRQLGDDRMHPALGENETGEASGGIER
jgi:multicomponent K+:H+ antiporter subunit C